MKRVLVALLLGLLSFFLMMVIGESVGLFAAFCSLTVYFFICQALLSRGNSDAVRSDWRLMLALNAVILLSVFIMVLVEKRQMILSQGSGLLLSCCGGTLAGAFAASVTARRAAVRR
jgi:hypothetical protein